MQTPLISVIMGVYNCADTLSQSIDSIIGQTYTNWELIVCDDGSTDRTYEVAEQYAKRLGTQMILLRNPSNLKLAYTLNRCIEKATGKLIARMDGDDISREDRFEKQLEYLLKHPEIQLVGTGMQCFDESGPHEVKVPPENPDGMTILRIVPFFHATIMTYREVYENLGGYTVARRTERVEDVDLWFRFFHQGYRGDNLPEPLYWVREDYNAIRRRTVSGRIHAFQTLAYGYRLSGFPRRWLIKPAILTVMKSAVPTNIVKIIRKKQGRL